MGKEDNIVRLEEGERKNKILDFLNTQREMVIATVDRDHNPEAALVGFAHQEDFSLIFGTSSTTRKFDNLQGNSRVAIVFGNIEGITIQYEGVVSIFSEDEFQKYKDIYFAKNPAAQKYENEPDTVYRKITPAWIRYTSHNVHPQEVFELSF